MTESKVGPSRRPKTGGRKAGTPNKMTAELKDMILKALDNAGGVDYLVSTAGTHPAAFLSLVGKVLPMQVTGEGGGPVGHSLTVTFK
jgi:hypothetical protein